jgi:hypothetical protein
MLHISTFPHLPHTHVLTVHESSQVCTHVQTAQRLGPACIVQENKKSLHWTAVQTN